VSSSRICSTRTLSRRVVSRKEAIDYVERDHGGDRRDDQQASDPQQQSLHRSKHAVYFDDLSLPFNHLSAALIEALGSATPLRRLFWSN
jgi:hypothetical protein